MSLRIGESAEGVTSDSAVLRIFVNIYECLERLRAIVV